MAVFTIKDRNRAGSASRSWRTAASGLAVLVSLSIHAAVFVLIPERRDSGTAVGAGQGGIIVSLGAAGREAGSEVMKADAESLDRSVDEVAPDIVDTMTPVEQVEPVETVIAVAEVQPATVQEVYLRDPMEPALVEPNDVTQAAGSELLLPETPSELAALKSATQEEVETLTETTAVSLREEARIASVPPLPKRRPDLPKPNPTSSQVTETMESEPKQKPVSMAKRPQTAPSQEATRERAATPERGSTIGRADRQTSALVTGAGGRSGSSGPVDGGQETETQGGGVPGAESDYLHVLRVWLEKHKRYPRRSKLRNEQGVVLLHLVVARNGDVSSFAIAKSSGHRRLDSAVLNLVERARPMPPLPGDLDKNNVNVVIPVEFSLH